MISGSCASLLSPGCRPRRLSYAGMPREVPREVPRKAHSSNAVHHADAGQGCCGRSGPSALSFGDGPHAYGWFRGAGVCRRAPARKMALPKRLLSRRRYRSCYGLSVDRAS